MGATHFRQPAFLLPRTQVVGGYEIKTAPRYTEEEFVEYCADNREMRIEQGKNGTLIIRPLLDTNGGIAAGHAQGQLFVWSRQLGHGQTFSPNTGFKLPDGSIRSADGAWVSDEKMAALSAAERSKFARLVPDFVIEVRSTSDRIGKLKKKMTGTWMANGVRLAWLIDPKMRKAYVYRPGQAPEEIKGFDRSLSGEDVCLGFELDLRKFL